MRPPPQDADAWSEDDWLAWLIESDPEADARAAADAARRRPRPPRRRLGSQLIAAAMTGIQEAIYGPKDKHAIVIEASGGPPADDPLALHLDPDHPERSVVVVRPWLLRRKR